jgi:hypothetical protein
MKIPANRTRPTDAASGPGFSSFRHVERGTDPTLAVRLARRGGVRYRATLTMLDAGDSPTAHHPTRLNQLEQQVRLGAANIRRLGAMDPRFG